MNRKPLFPYFVSIVLLLVLCGSLTGCKPAWEVDLEMPDGEWLIVNKKSLEPLEEFSQKVEGLECIPLERVLVAASHSIVNQIHISNQNELDQIYEWDSIAEDTWVCTDGKLLIQGTEFLPDTINVSTADVLQEVEASIIDIAPTAASALGLGTMELATGKPLIETESKHVFLIFLDAFGYVRYQESLEDGLIPFLATLDTPLMALTVYPPATVPASASVLTGTTKEIHGVDERNKRKTESETLFDIAAEAGLNVRAVEGDALSFQLRNADFMLSGDRNNDGSTNDEVFANARAVLEEGMPDIFWVHFHGIDDDGHTYGPGSPEEEEAIQYVDMAVEELVKMAPESTLIIIFADHGMHLVYNTEKKGNHGHLIPRDMLIPIFILEK